MKRLVAGGMAFVAFAAFAVPQYVVTPETLAETAKKAAYQGAVNNTERKKAVEIVLKPGVYELAQIFPRPTEFAGRKVRFFIPMNGGRSVYLSGEGTDPSKVVLVGDGVKSNGCHAIGFGARIFLENLTVRGCRTEKDGAAVFNLWGATNCVFEDCRTEGSGGAATAGSFTDCAFRRCGAAKEGGALKLGPNQRVDGCRFENCRARENGGALRVSGVYRSFTTVSNCTFVACRAENGYGGAVYVTADSRGKCPVIGCMFKDCFAPVRAPAERRDTSLGWCAFPHSAAIVERDCTYSGNFLCDYGRKGKPTLGERILRKAYVNAVTVRPGDDLAAVRDLLRAKRDPKGLAEVIFEDGVYELTNRVELTERDSKATWRARHPGKAIIVGGWSFRGCDMKPLPASDPLAKRLFPEVRGKVRTIAVPECLRTNFVAHAFVGGLPVLIGSCGNYSGFDSNKKEIWGAKYPRHPVLSIDTHLMTPARWPNADNEDFFSPGSNMVVKAAKGVNPVVRVPDGRLARWQVEDADINVAGFLMDCIYATGRAAVTKVDPAAGTAEIAHGGICGKSRFAFYNVMEEIDVPGEWCYDRKSGRLVVYPPEGFSPDSICALGVSADSFFRVRGSDIALEGFKFTAKHSHPAVVLEGGERNRIVGCRFSGLEYEAVYVNGRSCRVQSCDFEELNAAGVRVTGGSGITGTRGRNVVENCRFRDFCRMKDSWATGGCILAGGAGNAVRHCEISDSIEHGLDYFGFGHLVEYNRIYDCSYQFGDSGAVYSKGGSVSFGCTFRYNDVSSAPGYVHAIYFDDTTSGHRIYGNICRGYGSFGIFIGGGRDNVISNNLVCAAPGIGCRFDERGLFWPSYLGQNLTNILTRLRRDYRLDDPTSPLARDFPAFAATLKDPDERWAAPVDNRWVNNIVLDVGDEFFAAQQANGIRIKPGEYISEGNLAVRTTGKTRPGDNRGVWYLGGVRVLDGEKDAPIDLGFIDVPKLEKKTKRRFAWKKGDFNLKPDALLFREMPQFQPIPFDKIGLYSDEWRTATRLAF